MILVAPPCRPWFLVLLCIFTSGSVSASEAPPPGLSQVVLDQRSPHSAMDVLAERFGQKPAQPVADYDLREETFSVYVPAGYDGQESFGLIVWIDAGDNGAPPTGKAWEQVLDRHKLLWIGAGHSGNDRNLWHRMGLALDAAHHMTRRYRVDRGRLYLAGVSGGGRVASRLGLTCPDIFAGVFCIVGVDFFTPIPAPASAGEDLAWPARFRPPPAELQARARQVCRYVLLTGEHDPNRDQTRSTYLNGLMKLHFRHATYLDVPGLGHELPDAVWFEKGVEALDAPLKVQ